MKSKRYFITKSRKDEITKEMENFVLFEAFEHLIFGFILYFDIRI